MADKPQTNKSKLTVTNAQLKFSPKSKPKRTKNKKR
jgi:hypothetical protein